LTESVPTEQFAELISLLRSLAPAPASSTSARASTVPPREHHPDDVDE